MVYEENAKGARVLSAGEGRREREREMERRKGHWKKTNKFLILKVHLVPINLYLCNSTRRLKIMIGTCSSHLGKYTYAQNHGECDLLSTPTNHSNQDTQTIE